MTQNEKWSILWQDLLQNCFTQTYGVDHNENFTLVAKFVSIHYIVAILTLEDMESIKWNEKNCFNKDFEEEIYME
jgi:hypothetical protein